MSLKPIFRGGTGWVLLVCGAMTAVAGALGLVGWALGSDALMAMALVALGVALTAAARPATWPHNALIGSSTLAVFAMDWLAARLGQGGAGLFGRPCYEVVHGTDAPPDFCPLSALLRDGQEHTIETTEGRIGGTFVVTATPLRDARGEVWGAVQVAHDITARRQAEEVLRKLSLQLSRAEEEERRRIARKLHDDIGQKLAALSMTVGRLQDAASAPAGQREQMFADSLAMIQQCAQKIRTLSYLLHPPLLDELGLAAAIGDYVEGFAKRSGMQVALDAPPRLERLPAEVEIALFRVVQESLGNIHRHAGASTARIRLARDAEQVTLEVSDRGRGMSAETIRAIEAGRGGVGVGIAGMRERLRLLGGRLEIETGGQGTTLRAVVPIAEGGRRKAERGNVDEESDPRALEFPAQRV